jgi:lipoprotein-releasing system ATP-binding protein
MIVAKDLYKSYKKLQVLKGISLEIQKGEIVSVVGASGAGKSTLLHILGTLDSADAGEVQLLGQSLQKLSEKQITQFRNQHIGFIFQFHNLLPEFTALENVCMPAWLAGQKNKESTYKALELLELLGLKERSTHFPSEMSGGEQQRVAVARALMNQPSVIFADEPSGNLDSANARELHQLFFTLRDKFQQTFVIVTHNQELADMADRKIELKDGKILN